MFILQNDENDYNYWQSRKLASDLGLTDLNNGDESLDRSILDTSDQDQLSFSDINTYPLTLNDYDLNPDQQKSYQLN